VKQGEAIGRMGSTFDHAPPAPLVTLCSTLPLTSTKAPGEHPILSRGECCRWRARFTVSLFECQMNGCFSPSSGRLS
jgi:hypothetical protein